MKSFEELIIKKKRVEGRRSRERKVGIMTNLRVADYEI